MQVEPDFRYYRTRVKQRVVIEFLIVEGENPIENYRRQNSVCGLRTVEVSTKRLWVRHFKSVERDRKQNQSSIRILG
jgi:hypothetical protein